ncbi:hypothetical protein WA556_005487, partial [Blastocystis sp. ATCC 50177/Nand II]
MIFLSLFSVLRDRHAVVTVELKNDIQLRGTIDSVDQYLNIKLGNVEVVNKEQYPQLSPIGDCFIRGSVIRYIHLSKLDVDEDLLLNAARTEAEE